MKKGLRILQDIALVPPGKNCTIIIRHADRDGALDNLIDNEIGLNDIGRRRAIEFGKALQQFNSLQMFTSPVKRCVETCNAIASGFGTDYTLEITELLGMSSPIMSQPEVAYSLMRSMGLNGFIEAYISGKIDRKIVTPTEEGLRIILSFALGKMRDSTARAFIMVTHDMIITPALVKFFGYDYRAKGLVPFLDGMVLYESDYGLRLCYAGKILKVSKDGTVKTQ
ncbi:MAG: histidine phosphatase family protein [Methanomassiliicoccales archaeon]